MDLDLSSIEEYQADQKCDNKQLQLGDFSIEQIGNNYINDVKQDKQYGYNIMQNKRTLNASNGFNLQMNSISSANSSQKQFRNNIRQILLTGREQDIGNNTKNQYKCNQQQEQFGQPMKGSFLQQMQKLCKTLSFQQKKYNIYNPQISCQSQIQLSQKQEILGNSKMILQQSRQKLKTKFYWEVPLCIEKLYIIDFKKCQKKSSNIKKKQKIRYKNQSIDFNCTNQDISRQTIASTKSMKRSQFKSKTNNISRKGSCIIKNNSKNKTSASAMINSKTTSKIITNIMKKSINSPIKKMSANVRAQQFLYKNQRTHADIKNKKKISNKFKL